MALLAAPIGLANGGSSPCEPQVSQGDKTNCPDLPTPISTLGLEKAATLVIKNNSLLRELNLSNLKKLTTLVIKNNNQLIQLSPEILALPQLTDITIEDNDQLTKLELLNSEKLNKENEKDNNSPFLKWMAKWRYILSGEDDRLTNHLTLVIKDNDCLGNLSLMNLSNLTKLRIEDNDLLEKINLHHHPSSTETEDQKLDTRPP